MTGMTDYGEGVSNGLLIDALTEYESCEGEYWIQKFKSKRRGMQNSDMYEVALVRFMRMSWIIAFWM